MDNYQNYRNLGYYDGDKVSDEEESDDIDMMDLVRMEAENE